MAAVVVGQTWSVLNHSHMRIEFRVERIEKDANGETRAFGASVGGCKPVSFTVLALSRGLRGARLVRHADGHEPYRPPPDNGQPDLSTTATASDYRKTKAPRGQATASPRMEEAFKMRYEHGVSVEAIAKHFGISRSLASTWCQKVRDKRRDERVRRVLAGVPPAAKQGR